MIEEVWTIERILDWTQNYFKEKRVSTARLDAELLLSHVCNCKRIDLYLNADLPLNSEERDYFRTLVRNRVQKRIPVAYLIKKKEFYSLSLKVEKGALIPRPDTETLVEQSIQNIRTWQKKHPDLPCLIAELGTGAGTIPLALCSELKHLHIKSVERSSAALRIAAENMELHKNLLSARNNQIELIQGSFLDMLPKNSFNFILSNPPYIPTSNIKTLQREICDHEPHLALDGGKKGVDFYHYLNKKAPSLLKAHGEMVLEMGSDQKDVLMNLFSPSTPLTSAWKECTVVKDLSGRFRVILLRKRVK